MELLKLKELLETEFPEVKTTTLEVLGGSKYKFTTPRREDGDTPSVIRALTDLIEDAATKNANGSEAGRVAEVSKINDKKVENFLPYVFIDVSNEETFNARIQDLLNNPEGTKELYKKYFVQAEEKHRRILAFKNGGAENFKKPTVESIILPILKDCGFDDSSFDVREKYAAVRKNAIAAGIMAASGNQPFLGNINALEMFGYVPAARAAAEAIYKERGLDKKIAKNKALAFGEELNAACQMLAKAYKGVDGHGVG